MQLLIVHHDAEVGEPLVQMVKDYTEHHCGFATNGAAALDWARGVPRCSLLISQLDGPGVNGLSLGGSLSEMFAGLQTMFLPDYLATDQRIELPHPKVFPEPIDGQLLLDAIARAETHRQTGLDLYHALDVLQMCCLSRRSGALQLVKGSQTAVVFLRAGNVVHAERGAARGSEALFEITSWEAVEFAYDYTMRAPAETIMATWDEAVIAAVERRKAQAVGRVSGAVAASNPEPAAENKTARRGFFGSARRS